MPKKTLNSALIIAMLATAGCGATGQNKRPNVYLVGQVNSAQEAKVIEILAVMPAQVEVDNSEAKKRAQIGGAVLGALLGAAAGSAVHHENSTTILGGTAAGAGVGVAAGSMVDDKVLVDGVSITYEFDKKTLNSAQIGRMCEYQPGKAVLVSMMTNETRIQPNSQCPPEPE